MLKIFFPCHKKDKESLRAMSVARFDEEPEHTCG